MSEYCTEGTRQEILIYLMLCVIIIIMKSANKIKKPKIRSVRAMVTAFSHLLYVACDFSFNTVVPHVSSVYSVHITGIINSRHQSYMKTTTNFERRFVQEILYHVSFSL